jgi:hypothetical protein
LTEPTRICIRFTNPASVPTSRPTR